MSYFGLIELKGLFLHLRQTSSDFANEIHLREIEDVMSDNNKGMDNCGGYYSEEIAR